MDKLRGMETFVAVVECGSFTGAAARLEMSAVMVGKYIALLEGQLGTRLLEPDRGFGKDRPGAIPVAGGLTGFNVVKIDAVQHQAGGVQPAQSRLHAFINQAIVRDR